ncbi:MAG TPA: hypothetical protein VFZ61_21190, partial [Polyangiales bacterium]
VIVYGPQAAGPTSPVLWLRDATAACWACVGLAHAPSLSRPLRLALVSYFADGTSLTSVSGERWAVWPERPGERVQDEHRVEWRDQVRDHQQALVGEPLSLSLEEVLARNEQASREASELMVTLPAHEGAASYGLPWGVACRFAARALFPSPAMRALRRAQAQAEPWPEGAEALPWIQARAQRQLQAVLDAPARPGVARAVFVITLLLFLLSMSVYGSLRLVAQITLVLLVHELGHWAAMRAFGYGEPAVFFVPFLGAVTAGSKRDASLGQRLFVLAAGPLPGLLAGALALAYAQPGGELHQLALMALVVNAANLLPLLPLDGGRMVQLLATQQHPRLDLALALGSVALLLGLGVVVGEPALLAIGALTALSLRPTWASAQLATRLGTSAPGDASALTLAIWRALQASTLGAATKMVVARQVFERLQTPGAPRSQRVLGWTGYVGMLGLAGVALFARWGSGARGRDEIEFSCSQFHSGQLPPNFPAVAKRLRCVPESQADLRGVGDQLARFGELPGGLCLRVPWLPAASGAAQREARARQTVRQLELHAQEQHQYDYPEGASEAQMRAGWMADQRRAITAVETRSAARSQDPAFDPGSAQLFLAYLRARISSWDRDDDRPLPEQRALEDALGRGGSCSNEFEIVGAHVSESGRLSVQLFGDPRPLAGHLCRSGCETLLVQTPREAEATDP